MLDPGKLVHRVDLECDDVTRTSGREEKTARKYATSVPAEVVFLSARERLNHQQIQSTVNVRVTMRYRTDLKPSHRIWFEMYRMEVKEVIPDLVNKDRVTVLCEARMV